MLIITMNKNLLQYTNYCFIILIALFGKSIQAIELTFEPTEPCVAVNKTVQLSVSGISNDISWQIIPQNSSGTIESSTTQSKLIYKAPDKRLDCKIIPPPKAEGYIKIYKRKTWYYKANKTNPMNR